MKIILPDDVKRIIGTLTSNGYEAYAVGGCVRDSILHRVPGDWDITTSAKPAQVKNLFRRTVDTGIQHGTVTVMMGHTGYEVTTYRVDGEYEDSRHPKSVEFTASLCEDLKRRDFTINAMAYNDDNGIVDEFGGMDDLENGVIKCVGNPDERFTEDALRMLRAVRFSAQLGFEIESGTCDAIRKLSSTIAKISSERIHTELGKILLSPNPEYIHKAFRLGMTAVVFPEYDAIDRKDIILKLLRELPEDIAFRYAALLCEKNPKDAAKTLRRLKLDNETIRRVSGLITNHNMTVDADERSVRRRACNTGSRELHDALIFEKAFYHVTGNTDMSIRVSQEKETLDMIVKRGDCISIGGLAINGKDLMELGIAPGREIGCILNKCLDEVIDFPERNTKETLLQSVQVYKSK